MFSVSCLKPMSNLISFRLLKLCQYNKLYIPIINQLNYHYVHTSSKKCAGDKIFYEPSKKGDYEQKIKKEKITLKVIRENLRLFIPECKKFKNEIKEKLMADPKMVLPGDSDKIFDFQKPEMVDHFIVTCDSDWDEGYSKATFTRSPTGHALFAGSIDATVPEDGVVSYSGYCNIMSILPRKSFFREIELNWEPYTHLIMRVRGDGRTYGLVLNTAGEYDATWNDRFLFPLYTRGGPYWQDVKVPFSKFYFNAKGRVQDKQFPVPLNNIKSFGITLADTVSSDFRLEIDYVGLYYDTSHQEVFAYETYRVPPFI